MNETEAVKQAIHFAEVVHLAAEGLQLKAMSPELRRRRGAAAAAASNARSALLGFLADKTRRDLPLEAARLLDRIGVVDGYKRVASDLRAAFGGGS